MGMVDGVANRPAMEQLFSFLARQLEIQNFVETGTYRGETSRFASGIFSRVITIEGSENLFRAARGDLRDCTNVQCYCGDSRNLLGEICSDLVGPSLFWLDAHWSGGETFGETAECPLLTELNLIYENVQEPVIVVDDARFFVSIPPEPHDISAWPTYFQIADSVRQHAADTLITLYADSIVLVPERVAGLIVPFLRRPLDLALRTKRRNRWLPWRRSA